MVVTSWTRSADMGVKTANDEKPQGNGKPRSVDERLEVEPIDDGKFT